MAVKSAKQKNEAQQPLILRAHRLMEAFAKSDDERDFYLDRLEGFIVYVDLDKSVEDLDQLENELKKNPDRYALIPKLAFYETKKIMEGFVNEKVYDIDTKEKLLDIIQSKEARANFLEFIYDHLTELEKWQQYYQERSRVRIIEWLRQFHFHFVFEEDLEFTRSLLEKLKQSLFESKIGKDVQTARKILITKAKSYYSNEALNPRPKRGRPPKQAAKQEIEPQITSDVYLSVPTAVRPFLFSPDISSGTSVNFSADFDHGLSARKQVSLSEIDTSASSLQHKLLALRQLSGLDKEPKSEIKNQFAKDEEDSSFDEEPNGKNNKSKAVSKKKPLRSLARIKTTKPVEKAKSQKHKRIIMKQTPVKNGKKPTKILLKQKGKSAVAPKKNTPSKIKTPALKKILGKKPLKRR